MWDAILNKVVREGLPGEVMLLQRPAEEEAESPRDRISGESDPGCGNKASPSTKALKLEHARCIPERARRSAACCGGSSARGRVGGELGGEMGTRITRTQKTFRVWLMPQESQLFQKLAGLGRAGPGETTAFPLNLDLYSECGAMGGF